MITEIKYSKLILIGIDSWCRPVYDYDGLYFKDLNTVSNIQEVSKPTTLYCSYYDIEGEPDFPVKIIDE